MKPGFSRLTWNFWWLFHFRYDYHFYLGVPPVIILIFMVFFYDTRFIWGYLHFRKAFSAEAGCLTGDQATREAGLRSQ